MTAAVAFDESKLDPIKNMRLIKKVAYTVHARRFAPLGLPMDKEDLVQELVVVWLGCVEKFDPTSGFQFSTYFMRAAYNRVNRIFKLAWECNIQPACIAIGDCKMQKGDPEDSEVEFPSEGFTPEDELEYSIMAERVASGLSKEAREVFMAAMTLDDKVLQAMDGVVGNRIMQSTSRPIIGALRLVNGDRNKRAKIKREIQEKMLEVGCAF